MATVISLQWAGVSPAQYDRVVEILDIKTTPAEGGLLHIAGFQGDSLHVTDVWESPAKFEAFLEARLRPALAEAEVEGEPSVNVYDAYNYFRNPGVEIPEVGAARVEA